MEEFVRKANHLHIIKFCKENRSILEDFFNEFGTVKDAKKNARAKFDKVTRKKRRDSPVVKVRLAPLYFKKIAMKAVTTGHTTTTTTIVYNDLPREATIVVTTEATITGTVQGAVTVKSTTTAKVVEDITKTYAEVETAGKITAYRKKNRYVFLY